MRKIRVLQIIELVILVGVLIGLVFFFKGIASGTISFSGGTVQAGIFENTDDFISTGEGAQEKREQMEIKGIDEISVEFMNADIDVEIIEGDEIQVIETTSRQIAENDFFKMRQIGSQLSIKGPTIKKWLPIDVKSIAHSIYIGIPASYKEDLYLKTISGYIQLNTPMKLDKLRTEQVSGALELNELVDTKSLKCKSVSGSIYIKEALTEKYSLENVSGSIEVEALTGMGNVESVSGNIQVAYKAVEGDVDLSTVSGQIEVSLDEEVSCEIRGKSVSGKMKGNIAYNYIGKGKKEAQAEVGNNPEYQIDIETVSGYISVDRE